VIRTVLRQVKWEQRQFWRNPPSAVFTVVFPLMFLFVLSGLFHSERVSDIPGTPKYIQVFVPGIVAYGVINACYFALGFTLCVRRDQGVLKRKRGTPLSVGPFVTGMIANSIVIAAILSVVTIVSGIVIIGIDFPQWGTRLPTLIVTLLVGAFCFSSWGIAVSTMVPNQEAATAIFNITLLPLLFISGTFARVSNGSAIAHVAALFPIWHLNKAVEMLFLPPPVSDGAGWQPMRLLVLAGWGVAGMAIAAKRFRWEPSSADGPKPRRSRARREAPSTP
jgi:ABC-2 type transport system permease protein